jgi:DNA-binding GntR family transcriptional regulator
MDVEIVNDLVDVGGGTTIRTRLVSASTAGHTRSPGRTTGQQDDETCYLALRDEIVSGALMPNQRLVEADLAGRLQVGRAAVRTALVRLEHEGLITRERNRGAHVRLIGEEEAIEITQVRAVLEGLAAHQAAVGGTDADLAEIRAIHAQMPGRLGEGDLLGYSELNARLHARILAASGHGTAQRLITTLKAQLVRFQYRTILVPGRSQTSLGEHTAIVEAIVARDGPAAEAAMRAHLSSVSGALVGARTGAEDGRTSRRKTKERRVTS